MKSLFPEQSLGDYFIFLGSSLSCLITGFTIYDSYHRLIIFKNSIIIKSPFKTKAIKFAILDIAEVFNLTGPTSFGTVTFALKNKKKYTCFFIDNPEEVKQIVESLIKLHQDKVNEDAIDTSEEKDAA